jgi:hypothetical protein
MNPPESAARLAAVFETPQGSLEGGLDKGQGNAKGNAEGSVEGNAEGNAKRLIHEGGHVFPLHNSAIDGCIKLMRSVYEAKELQRLT